MKKEFVEPEVEVIEIDDVDVICTSCPGSSPGGSGTQGIPVP